MGKIISFTDAREIPRLWNDELNAYEQLFDDAEQNGNTMLYLNNDTNPPSLGIIYRDDDIYDNYIGFMIEPTDQAIKVWFAVDDNGSIERGSIVCMPFDIDTSLSTIIAKCEDYINKCPACGKEVPYKDQKRYSVAGRCCMDCYEHRTK